MLVTQKFFPKFATAKTNFKQLDYTQDVNDVPLLSLDTSKTGSQLDQLLLLFKH